MSEQTSVNDRLGPDSHGHPASLQYIDAASRPRYPAWIDGDVVKRVFDLVAALVLVVFLAPVMILIALLIRLQDGGPALYAHRRVGRHGLSFPCLKFRTMCQNGDAVLADCLSHDASRAAEWHETRKLREDPRVLRIGHILRKSSLDELPQLFNVIAGQMSLVGPRPVTSPELVEYGDDLIHYLAMRPGVSGLWQVSGRNDTTYAERVAFDKRYALERSFAGDIHILWRTIDVVFRGRGAY